MLQITAPEILWRIFSLVESNGDLARASRLNKFIGTAALDVLWNDIPFNALLSLLPTVTTKVQNTSDQSYEDVLVITNIATPLLPEHWHRVVPYARRVRTLRRSPTKGMGQILPTLERYDRGSELPYIFPKLRCLVWDSVDSFEEVSRVARLFFSPTLRELHIRGINDTSSSLLFSVPLDIALYGHLPNLSKLHLQAPKLSAALLDDYHTDVMDLLSNFPQLEDVGIILTGGILHKLALFSNLRILELYDITADRSNLQTPKLNLDEATFFQSLESLSVRNLGSSTSLEYLGQYHCVPSHRMRISFLANPEIDQPHCFHQILHLLSPSRKATLEILEVEGSFDLQVFLDSLFTFPNIKELCLGPDNKFDINDNTLKLMGTKWRNFSHLSLYDTHSSHVTLQGIMSVHDRPIQSVQCFVTRTDNSILLNYTHDPSFSISSFRFRTNFTEMPEAMNRIIELTGGVV